jgi:hypothetical protein
MDTETVGKATEAINGIWPHLNEMQGRLFAASQAKLPGCGGSPQ